MRKLWTSNNWNEYICEKSRPGIRLKFDKNVDAEVKRACKQYVNWLRTQYYFPIRVPIYLKSSCEIKSCAGITHELTHYFQWIKHHDEWCYADDVLNNYYERQALYYANVIVYSDYANIVDHP